MLFHFQMEKNKIIDMYEMPSDGKGYIILYIPKVFRIYFFFTTLCVIEVHI